MASAPETHRHPTSHHPHTAIGTVHAGTDQKQDFYILLFEGCTVRAYPMLLMMKAINSQHRILMVFQLLFPGTAQ